MREARGTNVEEGRGIAKFSPIPAIHILFTDNGTLHVNTTATRLALTAPSLNMNLNVNQLSTRN